VRGHPAGDDDLDHPANAPLAAGLIHRVIDQFNR
jgi:hypothetical protein